MTLQLQPPSPDRCQICADKHDSMQAHNAQNFYTLIAKILDILCPEKFARIELTLKKQ